jgi:hypothetical protein
MWLATLKDAELKGYWDTKQGAFPRERLRLDDALQSICNLAIQLRLCPLAAATETR